MVDRVRRAARIAHSVRRVVFVGDMVNRLVGLEIAGIIITMLLLTLSIAYGRDSFLDLSLAMALVSFGGGLVFARFIERWL